MERSRISKRLENNTKKTIMISVLGILVILFLIFQYGVPLLVNFGLLLTNSKQATETKTNKKDIFVAPPVLNPMHSATNSARVIISGSAFPKQEIVLVVNGEVVEKQDTDGKGRFSFEEIRLNKGENAIRARAITEEKAESELSEEILITYVSEAPKLTIDSPADNETFSKDNNAIEVKGKTDPGAKVTVNGFWAILDDEGNFVYRLTLQNGENKITIEAIDNANNSTKVERKVTYNP